MQSNRLYFSLYIFYFIVSINLVEMCYKSCEKYTYKPYIERIKYLVRLPDDTKLRELALIGTHSSLSYNVDIIEHRTQDLDLAQQLKYGIRVFDIRVRVRSYIIETYSYSSKTNVGFHDMLLEADKFLDNNPGEFIIILIRQVYPPELDKARSNCDIINFYIRRVAGGRRIVTKWRLEDTIGQHRGKILLAGLDKSFDECSFDIRHNCEHQSDVNSYHNKNYHMDDKWWDIIVLINHSRNYWYKCYINEVNYDDGTNNHRVFAKDGGYDDSKEVCLQPLNRLMTMYFKHSHVALNIVIADHVTQELMDKINDGNFPNSSWRIGWE